MSEQRARGLMSSQASPPVRESRDRGSALRLRRNRGVGFIEKELCAPCTRSGRRLCRRNRVLGGRGREGAVEGLPHSRAPALPGQSRSGGERLRGGRGGPSPTLWRRFSRLSLSHWEGLGGGHRGPFRLGSSKGARHGVHCQWCVRRAPGAGTRCGVPARSGAGTLRVEPGRRHHATPASEAPGSAHSLRDHRRSAAHAPRRGYRDGALHAR